MNYSKFHTRLDLEIEMYVFQTPASQVWAQICHIPHCYMSTMYGALAHIVFAKPSYMMNNLQRLPIILFK